MLSSSTNGDRFVNTFGSVFGSFLFVVVVVVIVVVVVVVVIICATSASSQLISLRMPDDVLSDVVEPVRMPHQSVVWLANDTLSLCVGDADFDFVPSSLHHCRMNFNARCWK